MAHRILVVDDDADIRETLVEVLEDAGHETISAANGIEALERLRSSDAPPCLILLDLMMPVMDGRTFREEQLKDPALAAIPIVVLSAFRDASETAAAMQAQAHLPKPVSLAELVRVVASFC